MLQQELKRVSELITNIIRNDEYCDTVEPLFLREAVSDYPLRAGKRLRPALLLWTCGLLGGDARRAEYVAAAVEVYHNWTLVHDDIIDDDNMRRGMPTTHVKITNYGKETYKLVGAKSEKFGYDFAMLTGDLQNSWANSLLLKTLEKGVSAEIVLSIYKDLFGDTTRQLINGEALDVDFSYRKIQDLSVDDVERMICLKTGALLNFCVKAGAKIALNTTDDNHEQIRKIVKFASAVGMAFQLRDDWLGIYGDSDKLGKPIGSDVCSAKPTVLVLETLKRLSREEKLVFIRHLGKPKISTSTLDYVKKVITDSGAEYVVLEKIQKLKNDAEKTISSFCGNKYRELLVELNNYLLNRKV